MQIHELNNYTGTLSDAYMVVDDGADTGKEKIEDITAPLDARIDNIIAGPASSAEEVIDARLGADGVAYPSLGDAIRNQFANIDYDITALKSGDFVQEFSGKDIDVYIPVNYSEFKYPYSRPRVQISHSAITYTSGVMSFYIGFYDSNRQQINQAEIKNGDQAAASAEYQMAIDSAYIRIVLHSTTTASIKVEAHNNLSLSAIKSDIAGLLKKPNIQKDIDVSTIGVDGYFILAANGSLAANADFKISEPIALKAGEKIIMHGTGYLTNVAMISIVNDDNTYAPVVASRSSTYEEYEYTAPADVNVVICANKVLGYDASVYYLPDKHDDALQNELDSLSNGISDLMMDGFEKVGTLVSNKQVQAYNGMVDIANANSNYAYAVEDVTNINRVRIVCQAGTNVNYQIGYIFATTSGAVISQYNDTSGEHTVEVDVPAGAEVLYVNNNGVSAITPSISKAVKVSKQAYADLSLFSKFGVVGDSYASGELYYNNSYTDKYSISWGQILARKHGITCTNYSEGGLTTRSWLTSAKGLALVNSSPADDLYLLALGINDYYSLGQAYLGSLSDITDYQSYQDYGDTFYGNYGRIIEQIQAHAPHAKIVMFTVANTNTVPQMFSDAIIEIAEYYSIPYVVQADDAFFQSSVYNTMSGGHPTAIGYSGMAVAFERLLNKCIVNNLSYFFNLYMYD